jgi:Hypoxia induced protein conserved region
MSTAFYILVPFAIAIVAVVLGFGLVNMMRGGSPERSQKLMQLRVLVQAVALAIMLAAIYFTRK